VAVGQSRFWNFCQTMAWLHLAARGQNVRTQLPEIVRMLESDQELERPPITEEG